MKIHRKIMFYITLSFLGLVMTVSIFTSQLAPHNPFDFKSIELSNANIPPSWLENGLGEFLLGTDHQGKDIFSTLLYSMRISLIIAGLSVLFSMIFGVCLGLVAGYYGGMVDTVIMRIVDIKLALPAILIAMMVGGIMRNVFEVENIYLSIAIIVFTLSIATWSIYTRAVRSIVIREVEKDYVHAVKLMGLSSFKIIVYHVLPNVVPTVGVLMILDFANCIMLESTLSFLGIGLSPSIPSLGTTIKAGADYFLSGSWWILIFPALALVCIIYSSNYVKDYLEDKKVHAK